MDKFDNVNNKPLTGSENILELIHAIMHLTRARQFQALKDTGAGLTPLEARVLGFFSRRPGATHGDLVQHSGRDKGQLARLVHGLREQGLLEARPAPGDRRVQQLYPTPAAAARLAPVQAVRQALAEVAAGGLSAAECEQLQALLRRVHRSLQDAD